MTIDNTLDVRSDRVTSSIVMVDPVMAERWLDRNTRNRRPRRPVVERYTADMLAGRWTFAGDPIRFSASGDLLDGQHRLTAIVASGVTVPLLIVRGLADEAQTVMDQGAKRSGFDQLSLKGYAHASLVASSARLKIIWEQGWMFKTSHLHHTIGVPWVARWVEEHPQLVRAVQESRPLIANTDAIPSSAGVCAMRFEEIDGDARAQFFELLAHGAGGEGHPITALDKRLARLRREHITMPERDHIAMFVQAWNAWRTDRTITKFQRPRGGSWTAENFPEPR